MLDRLIALSVRRRGVVLTLAALVATAGALLAPSRAVDVLPELTKPTVSILVEAPGLSPEEVEARVTAPLEAALLGTPRLARLRTVSGAGLAVLHAELAWDTRLAEARAAVSERLALARERLPAGASPALAPASSLMGEILLVGLARPDGETTRLREWVDVTLAPRLLAVPGVSQVTALGGARRELQVLVDPIRLRAAQLSLGDVETALRGALAATPGGLLVHRGRELLVANVARTSSAEELGAAMVTNPDGVRVPLGTLARIVWGEAPRRGDAGVDGRPAVVVAVSKQPGVDTREATRAVEAALKEAVAAEARVEGAGAVTARVLFAQSRFIEAAVGNVREALRDGVVLVAVVLLVFLANLRTTAISLVAIPLSLTGALLVFSALGLSIDTMTLGGLAIATGELVDDAIVDVENVFRRLRENLRRGTPAPADDVVVAASSEVRGSIVFATFAVVLAALPLFALPGLEGRLFAPLGLAYVAAVLVSLLVSLTVTPALASLLLPRARALAREKETPLVRAAKRADRALVTWVLPRSGLVLALVLAAAGAAASLLLSRRVDLLPPFAEGSLTATVVAPPGTPLDDSARLGAAAERLLLALPEVASTGRRTGRAEHDEHAQGVHYTEIDVALSAAGAARRAEAVEAVRGALARLPGADVAVGAPIGHRLEHLLSGVEASIVVKLSGPDLAVLRKKAAEARRLLEGVPGVVDLAVEPQVDVPRLVIRPRRAALALHGAPAGVVAEELETALHGRAVGEVREGLRAYDLVLKHDEPYRATPEAILSAPHRLPDGGSLPLGEIVDMAEESGPYEILRDDGRRRVAVTCNLAGGSTGKSVAAIREALSRLELPSSDYAVSLSGPFESQERARRLLLLLAAGALALGVAVLLSHFRSAAVVLQILVNVPLALAGSVAALALTGQALSIASLVGFVTVAGIATRNTIMMVSHYLYLMRREGEGFTEAMVIRGSLERLVPVLMTAATTALALVPLVLAAGEPGKEILSPMAVVILGGLVGSTLLDMLVTPALFWRFGKRAAFAAIAERDAE